MKKARIPFLSIGLIVMAVIIVNMVLNQNKEVVQAEEMYEEISETVKVTSSESKTGAEPETETAVHEELVETTSDESDDEIRFFSEIDFDALREKNQDIVAWITVGGTKIDYPIVFDGTDDYLDKSIEGKKSATGSIFIDEEAENIFNDFLTIVYGHHMKSGSMFAAVDDFNYENFWNNHKDVTVYTDDCKREYIPYLCVVGKGDADIRSIKDVESLSTFCEGKTITQGEIPEEMPQTVTLVTCNYSGNDYRTYLFCGIAE